MSRTSILALSMLVTGCGLTITPSTHPDPVRTIEVINQYPWPIEVRARIGPTVMQRRLARVPPRQTMLVRVPAAYFQVSDLRLEVCRVDRIAGQPNCATTDRYQGMVRTPVLVIRPGGYLTADLYGD